MLQHTIPVGHALAPESLTFEEPGNAAWAATVGGELVTVRLLDGAVSQLGGGYRHPVGVVPMHDGLTVAIVERTGRIWLARRDQAARARAQLVADLPGSALAARRHPDTGKLLVLTTRRERGGDADPTIFAVDSAQGTVTEVASGLRYARTFVADDARRQLVVLTVTPSGARKLSVVGLDDAAVTPVPGSIGDFDTIVLAPDASTPGVIGVSTDATSPGRLQLIHLDGTLGATMDPARPVVSMARWGSLLLLASGTDLIAVEWDLDGGTLPIDAPLGPLYVNGYARLAIALAPAGLALADVEFLVREGPEAGTVSGAIEPQAPDGTQPVVLLAGFRPGEYHLEARRRADGSVLATRRFRVTASWPDELVGPPVATVGPQQLWLMSWGGAGAGPAYIKPAPESIRVAIVLVSTNNRRWGDLEAGAKSAWRDRLIGPGNSARRYYEEVSYRGTAGPPGSSPGTTVELLGNRILGPVDLQEGWGDLFEPKKGGGLDGGWMSKATGRQILASAISGWLADQPDGAQILELADAIVIVVRSASDGPIPIPSVAQIPTLYVWGHADRTNFWRKNATTFTEGPKPVTLMTDAYPAALPVAPILEHTLCHELGHNIGLADLYDANGHFPAEVNARTPRDADLMASSRPLPHFSIANRMRLGWVQPAWLRRFDFSASPTGGTVTLHAAERLTRDGPPAGRFAGIEVPLQDGWSYFFELRRTQAGQIGDQQLNPLSASQPFVLGTDLRVPAGEPARPPILKLPADADGDGPVLDTAGEDYEESDVTNPAVMHDFSLRVQTTGIPDADSAVVQVDYIGAHRPQLQIRPAPGRGNFKSPDIDVVGAFGAALPWVVKGAPNAIRITVHNRGTLAATQVQIHVRWLPFTLSAGPWQALPDPAPFDVPALGVTSLVVPWNVPASVKVGDVEANHFCVRVEIERFQDPAHPEREEIVVGDNWAQSNFDAVSVPFGSPSDRLRTAATLTNPLGREATYLLTTDQSGDGYRVYVGHAWLRLPPGETRPVELAYESLAGDPVLGAAFEHGLERYASRANHVAVTSWLVPEGTECDTPLEWWGVSLDLRAGRRAWIDDVRRNGELVTGRVRASRNGSIIDVTHGDVHLAVWDREHPERTTVTQGSVQPDGTARVLLSNETLHAISTGARIVGMLARPADAEFVAATSGLTPLA